MRVVPIILKKIEYLPTTVVDIEYHFCQPARYIMLIVFRLCLIFDFSEKNRKISYPLE